MDDFTKAVYKTQGWYILNPDRLDLTPTYLLGPVTPCLGPYETFSQAKEAMLTEIEGRILELTETRHRISKMKETI